MGCHDMHDTAWSVLSVAHKRLRMLDRMKKSHVPLGFSCLGFHVMCIWHCRTAFAGICCTLGLPLSEPYWEPFFKGGVVMGASV